MTKATMNNAEVDVQANYTRCLCETCANEANYRSSKYGFIDCWNCCADCTYETMRDFKCFICRCPDYLEDPQIFEDREARRKAWREIEMRKAEEKAKELRKQIRIIPGGGNVGNGKELNTNRSGRRGDM